MLFAIAAFFCFAVMNAFAKELGQSHNFHAIELAFWRNLVCIIPMGIFIFLSGRKSLFIPKKPIGIAFRAIIGTISLCLTLATFIFLPMADATAILFTSTLLVPVASHFILKEQVGPYRWSAVIIGFIGVLIMMRPTGEGNMLGFTLGLCTAVSHTILQIHLRYLGKVENPLTTVFYFFVGGTVLGGAALPYIGHAPIWQDAPYILGLGAFGFIGQIFLTNAFKFAEASIVTVFNYSGMIWATALGWFIWGDWPSAAIWVGSSIIIACNLFIFWREHRKSKTITATPIR